ncbi:MAG: helix-turn-helix domain-containing protein [Candidatus Fimimonas sp.]
MRIFAVRLKELRLEKGFTQQQIAEMLDIRQQSYTRYEYGTGEPSLDTLVKIAKIFDVSTDYLLGLCDY